MLVVAQSPSALRTAHRAQTCSSPSARPLMRRSAFGRRCCVWRGRDNFRPICCGRGGVRAAVSRAVEL
eukprot:1595870-Pyramimonas_sp.AAC.1